MSPRKPKTRLFDVRVREIHVYIYTVEAKDEDDARDRYHEDDTPTQADAQEDAILSVKESPQ
jgi:hypothetical protein